MNRYKADLHIHSCLSPCGSLEMSPLRIVEEAIKNNIHILGLTDHNSAANTPAFEKLCLKNNILPVCGMEVTTSEELHALALFENSDTACDFGKLIYSRLVSYPNDPDAMGDQIIVDEDENIIGEIPLHLTAATDINLDELVKLVHERDGLIIPAHIDRPFFSVSSQLGFLPFEPFDAVESTTIPCPIDTRDFTVLTHSDAHYPVDICKRSTTVNLKDLSFFSLKEALLPNIKSN